VRRASATASWLAGEFQARGVAATDPTLPLVTADVADDAFAALREREQTGQGRHIDLALLDVQAATLANQAMNYLVSGSVPGRLGNSHPNIVPYQAFPAADGHLVLAVGNDEQFRRFCQVAGLDGLADDPAYATNAGRVARRNTLVPIIEDRLRTRPRDHWLQALEAVGVPCGPINDVAEVFADPQVQARDLQRTFARSDGTRLPGVANPIRFANAPIGEVSAAPALGQDTVAVLQSVAGLTDAEIEVLRAEGVVG
jgi:crotonobetainyl-CoA:carnitine CoA-transferase CaiB-like acyl-CoA transferase